MYKYIIIIADVMERNHALAVIAVLSGATLFGLLGICTRYFQQECGLSALETVLIRLSVSCIVLFLLISVFSRESLKIKAKDIPLFIVFGLFKIASDVTFFYAQTTIDLSMATLLQMTSPFYVMIVSLFLFRDAITLKKVSAMVMAMIGCILVTGIISGNENIKISGVLGALMSGMCFGMFLIGSRLAQNRGIKPEASLFYTLLIAGLIALPFSDVGAVADAVSSETGIIAAIALGVFMTMVPFFLYAWSVKYIEPTLSSILSVFELVVAAAVGFLVFGEGLSPLKIAGIILVISSVILMNIKIHIGYAKRFGKYVPPGLKGRSDKHHH